MERDPLLQERHKTHGLFATNAEISQKLKAIFWFYHENGSTKLGSVQLEALDMIALKLSRILSGQPLFKDHWDDIAGYAKLASEACDAKGEQRYVCKHCGEFYTIGIRHDCKAGGPQWPAQPVNP